MRPIRELAVVSGKGGTGKTSLVASFAALAENKVLADCDVDAADLHLVLSPEVIERGDFVGGKSAKVIVENCVGCGKCAEVCRFDAVSFNGPANDVVAKTYRIDGLSCEGCGVCAHVCPAGAVDFSPCVSGEYFISETRHGILVHARLGIARENSGKLVTLVRREARRIADERKLDLVIIDGAPGIGCPVIASLAGADTALIVTEATISGLHDLDRVADLAAHFGIPACVCINKCDINPEMTRKIKRHSKRRGLDVLGVIRYDPEVTKAQIAGMSAVEMNGGPAARDIRSIWAGLQTLLNAPRAKGRQHS